MDYFIHNDSLDSTTLVYPSVSEIPNHYKIDNPRAVFYLFNPLILRIYCLISSSLVKESSELISLHTNHLQ